jgi:RNA polymerase sigma factor (sigma-70 family)
MTGSFFHGSDGRETRNAVPRDGVFRTVVGRPLAEAELVEQAKRGEPSAYEVLVQRHQEIAFRTAYLVTGSAAEAEDAAQDAFVKAYRALGRFRSGAPFRPWLLQIVVNEARNRRRSAGRREHLALRAADEPSSGGAAPSPEVELLANERRARLLGALAELREDDRDVVVCRHLLGLSEEETSTALALPVGTVKSRLSRALARMRAALEEDP